MKEKDIKKESNETDNNTDLSIEEIEKQIEELEKIKMDLIAKKEDEKYKKIASSNIDEIYKFISQKANEAYEMDYLTNGGISYEVMDLIPYLSRDVMEEIGFRGEYLKKANQVLLERGEDPIEEGKIK